MGAEAQTTLEARWPPALALLLFLALNVGIRLWLPNEGAIRLPWLVPAIEAVLLVVLAFSHPGRLARHRRWLQSASAGGS